MAKTPAQLMSEIKPYLIRIPNKAARAIEADASPFPRGAPAGAKHWSASSPFATPTPAQAREAGRAERALVAKQAKRASSRSAKSVPSTTVAASTPADLDRDTERFLAFVPADRQDRTRLALATLADGVRDDGIYNTALQDAKSALDRAYEAAWKQVENRFPDRGYGAESAGWQLYNEFGSESSIRSAIATAKKLAKTKLDLPHVPALRELASAALPIALLIEALKPKIIKGKKPDPKVAARRAAQALEEVRMTCPCCFRAIDVYPNGKMADHGYELKEKWGKTGSCPGRDFRPLEVSNEGLVWMIGASRQRLARLVKLIEDAPAKTEITKPSAVDPRKHTTVSRGDAGWESACRAYLADLTGERDYVKRRLEQLETRLAAWHPTATDAEARGKSRKRSKAELDRDLHAELGVRR